MSVQMMAWAFGQDLPPAEKLVLLSLANHYNQETGICIPGQARVADECSMSVRTVQRHMAKLEQKGLISRQARMRQDGRGRTSDRYFLCADNPRPTRQQPSTNTTNQDDQHDSVVVGTGREPEEEPLAAKPRKRDLLFEAVAEAAGRKLDRLTKVERGKLNKATAEIRSAGGTPEEVRLAARAWTVKFPQARLTELALAAHWSSLLPEKKPTPVWSDSEEVPF